MIKSLYIKNFRNYNLEEIFFDQYLNIIIGNNAQGKTSLLEAIYLLGLTKSHRTNNDKELIKYNEEYSKISSLINLNNRDVTLSIILSKIGKKAIFNEIETKKLSEYIGILNVIMFSPEDLDLIKGNPSKRRMFLDVEIGQVCNSYLYNLSQYKKILKQRNELLKQFQNKGENNYTLLEIITEQLISYAKEIVIKREEFIGKINSYSIKIHKYLTNNDQLLKLTYIPSINSNFFEEYEKKYKFDILSGTTNLGPHRDDFSFAIDGYDVKSFCSQGEQRTVVLVIKLALIDYIFNISQNKPILLLDDVLSELDSSRQNNLIKYVKDKTQTFISSTSLKNIDNDIIFKSKVLKVYNGSIKESVTNDTKL